MRGHLLPDRHVCTLLSKRGRLQQITYTYRIAFRYDTRLNVEIKGSWLWLPNLIYCPKSGCWCVTNNVQVAHKCIVLHLQNCAENTYALVWVQTGLGHCFSTFRHQPQQLRCFVFCSRMQESMHSNYDIAHHKIVSSVRKPSSATSGNVMLSLATRLWTGTDFSALIRTAVL